MRTAPGARGARGRSALADVAARATAYQRMSRIPVPTELVSVETFAR
jgi:hypothetical protein